ncbi:MAG TPA: 4Fe-4S dicluster domain-containing protein [Geminicoccaceae bacterium]|jgi:ferredoxin|nr:4Fe-4S dicluster domain-containing protein [Geminicoccaceae bacterium]
MAPELPSQGGTIARSQGEQERVMELKGKRVLVCDCETSMPLDGKALAKACGAAGGCDVHTQLCRAQIDSFKAALGSGEPLLVGCTQEAPLFEETRGELGPESAIGYTNIRERAGWSEQGRAALPKIAALLAEATLDLPPTPTVSVKSGGECLVYGRDESAIEAARQLAPRLSPTVILTRPEDVIPPRLIDVPIFAGTVRNASGHIGAFELTVDGFAPMSVSSRRALAFGPGKDGVGVRFDLILDLSGEAPLVPAHDKRDGYFRPDVGNPAAVQRALFDLTDLVGEFDKPRYVDFKEELCAHARSGRTGCTRCLEVCPAAAIQPGGDVVAIDPFLCGGCGACNSVCPTGAAGYAYPPTTALLERLRTLLATYRQAGGEHPVLLVHDEEHGGELISLMSRFGRGLPANVIPFALNEVTQLGLDALLGALAYGAARILVVVPPKRQDELGGLQAQLGYADAALEGLGYGAGRLELLLETDPDALEAHLHDLGLLEPQMPAATFLPMGDKRALMRLALQELHGEAPTPADHVALPEGAPFGRVVVDAAGCTLCLACVSVCPTGALVDNPERPALSFVEDACVQCGLCRNTCPERVIRLEPRLNFADEARQPVLIKEEEPFECIRCGKPFGTRASIERIIEKLGEKHWMYQDSSAIDRIRMCDDCRVVVQFEATDNPLAAAPRPAIRTTDDYLKEREEIEAARARVKAERETEEG